VWLIASGNLEADSPEPARIGLYGLIQFCVILAVIISPETSTDGPGAARREEPEYRVCIRATNDKAVRDEAASK
jgi:hypothetical protein